MQILLNGAGAQVSEGATLEQVVATLELPKFFVVEHNKTIIYKENYANVVLSEGDEVEVAAFCGGG
jgi:thiamine biosynthesis protein ThiS